MLNVFISDLGAYNNGELTGEWHDLESPDGRDEARNAVISIMQSDDGEYFISDYESDHINIGEYDSIDKLCDIGEIFEDNDMSTQHLLDTVTDYDANTFDHLSLIPMSEFDDAMAHMTPSDIALRCFYGDFNPLHDYFILNGKANVDTYTEDQYTDMLDAAHIDIVKAWLEHVHDVNI